MSEMSQTDADSDAGLPDDSDEADDEIEVWNPTIHITCAFAEYNDNQYPKNNIYKVFFHFNVYIYYFFILLSL